MPAPCARAGSSPVGVAPGCERASKRHGGQWGNLQRRDRQDFTQLEVDGTAVTPRWRGEHVRTTEAMAVTPGTPRGCGEQGKLPARTPMAATREHLRRADAHPHRIDRTRGHPRTLWERAVIVDEQACRARSPRTWLHRPVRVKAAPAEPDETPHLRRYPVVEWIRSLTHFVDCRLLHPKMVEIVEILESHSNDDRAAMNSQVAQPAPRARGDVPFLDLMSIDDTLCSPHPGGCSLPVLRSPVGAGLLPAPVGMFPRQPPTATGMIPAPCTRGDVPQEF